MTRGQIKNRESFLATIREKIGSISIEKKVAKPTYSVTPQYQVHQDDSQEALIEVLKQQCQHIHTDFYQTNQTTLNECIQKVLQTYQARTVIYPNDNRFDDIEFLGCDTFQWDNECRNESISFSEQADVGITYSDITLAESGTVVLLNRATQGRSISLLPQYYIALIPKSTIVPRMTQATNEISDQVEKGSTLSTCINFITGPSNSADIEMNLVVGVHGPTKVSYIVIEDL
ncbi:hypothetical protein J416_15502 [Gracilibacillus halophilus YIM-C55.5]|uniref:LUD domain-containing protein n=1 Tax=Gracilibacillus halophilus YIM-C55.5 TaxID=1308866 RepID=N4WH90_9BACI|nr:lactate utilization protein C [Gracilibacillus halophilus]ENH95552.1 hypothetical protein J416_15502 [Gracilibacillus halophilus YIM-C55.5]